MPRPSLDEIFGATDTGSRPSLDEIFGATTPKPQFSTIQEAAAAMQQAQANQKQAEFGVQHPYYTAIDKMNQGLDLGKLVNNVAPSLLAGGAVTNTILRGGAAIAPTLARQVAAGMAGGAVGGAVAPADNNTQRALNAAGSAAVGGALPMAGAAFKGIGDALRNISTRASGTKSAEFAGKLRTAFVNVKKNAVDRFGKGLDTLTEQNPNTKIDLYENTDVSNILTDPNLPNEVRSVFNKTPILRDIIKGTRGPEVTLKESQEILNYINTKVPREIKASHIDLPEFLSEVKMAQSNAFPEKMIELRNAYAKVAQPYKDLKSQFRFNQLLGAIDKDFGGPEGTKALKQLFSDNPELVKQIGGYKKAGVLIKGAIGTGAAVGLGAAGKAGYELSR